MWLRDRTWRRFLNAPDPELLAELYEPALERAVQYDRCCAYFSSTVLAVAARGFGPLVGRLLEIPPPTGRPAIRLLVNEELRRDDVDAMLQAHGAEALAARLASRLIEPRDALERERLAVLGLLVQRGLLEVRVGVMRSGHGILHAKFGIVTDARGDALVFSGSGNESAGGLVANYESLEITGSWSDQGRFEHFRDQFETLWNGNSPVVDVIPLPDAVREQLIRYSTDEEHAARRPVRSMTRRQTLECWMRWRFALEAPWFPAGEHSCDALAPYIRLWPHQVRVVDEVSAAWPAGRLLCDEVGMGKTVEAIMILRRLMAGRGVRRVLLLVPAGIQQQWQAELREKGGLLVPRLDGQSRLIWPDGREEDTADLPTALRQPILLMSREMARLEQNVSVLLESVAWDLVLLDEAHAARRASQVETEFNSATLLLDLLRKLQLKGRARGLLLLSATPMQTQPWEPWDLLAVLGEGAPWLADFGVVRSFYQNIGLAESRALPVGRGREVAAIVSADECFPPQSVSLQQLPSVLLTAPTVTRLAAVASLRRGAPLGRRMHRNTRQTLKAYFRHGLIDHPPAERKIQDVRYEYADPDERDLYDGIQTYVDRRFRELEAERPGKGFVMTVYRRRAASSVSALRKSLERRKHGLELVARGSAVELRDELEASDQTDIDELIGEGRAAKVPSSLPDDPAVARQELRDVNGLLRRIALLSRGDSKLEEFVRALRIATDDGRPCLVFSEFTDTVAYLRDALFPSYGSGVACYTGDGGQIYEAGEWKRITKDAITGRLTSGEIRVLLCSDAASEGLNLQAASALINYDLPWNPARIEQRIGRIDRIGQRASELRIVNLVLAHSVDERVYQVLSQRCSVFQTFIGSMQPVLALARRMLLGVRPFDADELQGEATRAESDVVSAAAFQVTDELPPPPTVPGVTIDDLGRAFDGLGQARTVDVANETRPLVSSWQQLSADASAVPLSPFLAALRGIADESLDPANRAPLVMAAADEGPFRTVVAVWAGGAQDEYVERADRLEALLGAWNGLPIATERWTSAHAAGRARAQQIVEARCERALHEERAALERQVAAARMRLLRELSRFLVCAASDGEDLNTAFHRWMQRGGQTAALLTRVHGLIGYPEWDPRVVSEASLAVADLTFNQRKNVLLGTPLEAAIRDPRWAAAAVFPQGGR